MDHAMAQLVDTYIDALQEEALALSTLARLQRNTTDTVKLHAQAQAAIRLYRQAKDKRVATIARLRRETAEQSIAAMFVADDTGLNHGENIVE